MIDYFMNITSNISKRERIALVVSGIGLIGSIIAIGISIWSNNIQSDMRGIAQAANQIQIGNLELQQQVAKIAQIQMENEQRRGWFDVLQSLNESILSVPNVFEIKWKLLHGEKIQDERPLLRYLDNFEDVYNACHRGIAPKEDIKYSFEHHLGAICGNEQAYNLSKSGHGGLKKLCELFFPGSLIGKMANMNTNNCK